MSTILHILLSFQNILALNFGMEQKRGLGGQKTKHIIKTVRIYKIG
jgi:hypothetical protein